MSLIYLDWPISLDLPCSLL